MSRIASLLFAFALMAACDDRVGLAPSSPQHRAPTDASYVLLEAGTVAQFSAGAEHSCAVTTRNSVACWGHNGQGQSTPPAGAFAQVSVGRGFTCALDLQSAIACWGRMPDVDATPPAGEFRQISAGWYQACALSLSGTLVCWGQGDGRDMSPPAGTFRDVSVGSDLACALSSDGRPACWGESEFADAPPPSGTFTNVIVSRTTACALDADGHAACWGSGFVPTDAPPSTRYADLGMNGANVCGIRQSDSLLECWQEHYLPIGPPMTGQFTAVQGERYIWCALTLEGLLRCTNPYANDYGQASPPTDRFVQIAAAPSYVCGLRIDLTLNCWGDVDFPSTRPPGGTYSQVSAADLFTCAIAASDGTIHCWGYSVSGVFSPPTGRYVQVAAGGRHACAVSAEGTVSCWGSDSQGQASPPGGRFTQVSAGALHSCGIREDGSVACWGSNEDGRSTPPTGTFTQISAGLDNSCALRTDRSISCWGLDDVGQSTPPSGAFLQVGAAWRQGCAIRADGTLSCWGVAGSTPSSAPPLGIFRSLSVGSSLNCALELDQGVTCWGFRSIAETPNTTPVITSFVPADGRLDPVRLLPEGSSVEFALSFSDPVRSYESHSGVIDCGNGELIRVSLPTSTYRARCSYRAAGVYSVRASVTDQLGAKSAEAVYQYVIVYDPEGAFATGAGSFATAAGSQGRFDFETRFQPGEFTTPRGTLGIRIPDAQLQFSSRSIEMLVVSGHRVQFWGSGEGSIHDRPLGRFRLTVVDEDSHDGRNTGAIRVELWDSSGELAFDTQPGSPQVAEPTTPIVSGNITIHH